MGISYRKCPVCIAKYLQDCREQKEQLAALYGQLPVEEYEKRLSKIPPAQVGLVADHLDEDYTIGVGMNGVFRVSYRAVCSDCGFRFVFDHEEKAGGKK